MLWAPTGLATATQEDIAKLVDSTNASWDLEHRRYLRKRNNQRRRAAKGKGRGKGKGYDTKVFDDSVSDVTMDDEPSFASPPRRNRHAPSRNSKKTLKQ